MTNISGNSFTQQFKSCSCTDNMKWICEYVL
jgi:hypothetical protein